MNETFEDYCNRKGWSGYTAPLREIWDEWQRDREYLIANMYCTEQQRDELLAAASVYASNYLVDEYDSVEHCIDAEQHDAVVRLFKAIAKAIAKAGA